MKFKTTTVSPLFLNLAALMAGLLVLLRLLHIFSFNEPQHVITSGFEEESLLALFKMTQGMPVYTDPHQLPFAASYFNWFYYGLYGTITTFILQLFHLSDVWIPTIGRLITFFFATLGFFITYRIFLQKTANVFACSLSALLWYGPLVGYWAMTVRPDIVGLLFDVCALGCFLRYFNQNRTKAVLLAALFCYLSWSCKQINVIMPGAIGLYLLCHRRWAALMLFSGLLISLYALSFALMPDNARHMLFFVNTAIPLSISVFVGNAVVFMKKALPIVFLLAVLVVKALIDPTYRRSLQQSDVIQLSLCGLITWSLILLPASSKVGSAENYYFIAFFFLLLFVAQALCLLLKPSRLVTYGAALAGILYVGSIGNVILQNRTQTLTLQHQSMTKLQDCISRLPQPLFVINHYGALPWMNPSPEPFVLAYNYWTDRQAEIPFEHNGIGGLIQEGYFNALILPLPITDEFDGASLQAFVRQESCEGYAVFTRKGSV